MAEISPWGSSIVSYCEEDAWGRRHCGYNWVKEENLEIGAWITYEGHWAKSYPKQNKSTGLGHSTQVDWNDRLR